MYLFWYSITVIPPHYIDRTNYTINYNLLNELDLIFLLNMVRNRINVKNIYKHTNFNSNPKLENIFSDRRGFAIKTDYG